MCEALVASNFTPVCLQDSPLCFLTRACMQGPLNCPLWHLPLALGYVFDYQEHAESVDCAPFGLCVCVSMILPIYSTHSMVSRNACIATWTYSTHFTPFFDPQMCVGRYVLPGSAPTLRRAIPSSSDALANRPLNCPFQHLPLVLCHVFDPQEHTQSISFAPFSLCVLTTRSMHSTMFVQTHTDAIGV